MPRIKTRVRVIGDVFHRLPMRSPLQRLLLILVTALILPIVAVLTVLLVQSLSDVGRAIEEEALRSAEQMTDLADVRIEAELAALRVFSTSPYLLAGDWERSAGRARAVISQSPGWKAITIRDRTTRGLLLAVGAAQHDVSRLDWPLPPRVPATGLIGGVSKDGPGCPCVFLHARVDRRPDQIITLALDPGVIQTLVSSRAPRDRLAAVVDGNGRFVARTMNFEKRVGTLATRYVREAVSRGGTGVYTGRTYEGLTNYSAFYTSPVTGWSGHIAVERSLIDGPSRWAAAAGLVGALTALLVATGLVGYVIHDLSARRREEQQLLRLQKSEAIGRFASGIAHDFNNVLQVVVGNLDRVSRSTVDPETKRRVDRALDASTRGTKLANQLLSFARHDGAEIDAVDLRDLFVRLDALLGEVVGAGVTLTINVEHDARWICGNADQIELAVINLCVNARDAMAGTGEVRITTQRVEQWIELRVADTGPGVPEAVRDRLFEPFFTTKAPGHGTGLGLAQVAGAASQGGGRVDLRRAPEGGAIFVLLLRPAKVDVGKAAEVFRMV